MSLDERIARGLQTVDEEGPQAVHAALADVLARARRRQTHQRLGRVTLTLALMAGLAVGTSTLVRDTTPTFDQNDPGLRSPNPDGGASAPPSGAASSDGMRLSSTEVRPGDTITMTVELDGNVLLGLDTSMERWTGQAWEPVYVLFKKVWSDTSAGWMRVEDMGGGVGIPSIGLSPGPHELRIPDDAAPGRYRLREEVLDRGNEPVYLTAELDVLPG